MSVLLGAVAGVLTSAKIIACWYRTRRLAEASLSAGIGSKRRLLSLVLAVALLSYGIVDPIS
jgi:hypothetical protein